MDGCWKALDVFCTKFIVITVEEDPLAEWDLESEIFHMLHYIDDERGVILGSISNAPLILC
jgi:hypothetical protein